MLAGGTESMSMVPMMGNKIAMAPSVFDNDHVAIAYGMGITAEKVAEEWKVSREDQTPSPSPRTRRPWPRSRTASSRTRSARTRSSRTCRTWPTANASSPATRSPTPTKARARIPRLMAGQAAPGVPQRPVRRHRHCWQLVADERWRRCRAAGLGTGDQDYGLTPLARFVSFSVAGVRPEVMGIGPIAAIPKALKQAGLTQDQLDWIELNEAFAAQSLAVIRDCGRTRPRSTRWAARLPWATRWVQPARSVPQPCCTACVVASRSTAW